MSPEDERPNSVERKYDLPGSNLKDLRSHIKVDGKKIKITARSTYPEIVVMDDIFSERECGSLINLASEQLERSKVGGARGEGDIDSRRSSHGVFLSADNFELVGLLNRRISELLHWPEDHMEDLQILRYEVGQQYLPHYDFFNHTCTEGTQRLATLVIYLKEPTCGGGTIFPLMPLEIFPRQGSGIFFAYPDPGTHQSKRTLHGGSPRSSRNEMGGNEVASQR